MFEVLENGQVMKVEEVITKRQTITIRTPIFMFKKLTLSANKTNIIINEILPFQVKWQKFNIGNGLHEDDYTENSIITIKITGPGQPAEMVLNPVNGQAEFDFESPVAGTFTIRATADFSCDPGILEVTVNG